MRKIARHEGPLALWRGTSASLLMVRFARQDRPLGLDMFQFRICLNEHSPVLRLH